MIEKKEERQLGDFIKGRFSFIEAYAKDRGRDPAEALDAVKKEALKVADTEEKKDYLRQTVFARTLLSSSYIPDWVDKVLLEAMSKALQGPGGRLYTTSSRVACVTFEAGRFNARRQAESVFKVFFSGKTPEGWLLNTFPTITRECYGKDEGYKVTVEKKDERLFRVTVDNRGLEKADPMDCSTTVGYLFGAMEVLGAKDPQVIHTRCGALSNDPEAVCVYDVSWK